MLIKRSKIPYKEIIMMGLLPAFLKKLIYRLRGYRIGKHVKIGFGSIISGNEVWIGNNAKIGFFTIIRGNKIKLGKFVSIGSFTMIDTERIEIDDDARINEQVIIGGIRTPESFIKLGKRTIVMEYSFINPTKPVIIGDDTGIGGHCLLFTHGSWLSQLDGYPVSFEPITIGKNVWLPWRVFILPGTTIGDNVVIGANSLVSKHVPSNVLIAGSPAKIIKENYPTQPDQIQKDEILDNIFREFISYIQYYGYKAEQHTYENGFDIIITDKTKQRHIDFLKTGPVANKKQERIVIQAYQDDLDKISLPKSSMIINLLSKQRNGSSEIGEEVVKFFSRYGIRFDRLS